MPWHAWCYHHSQHAGFWRQGATKWKDGGCQAPEKAPAVSLQGRGRRVPNSAGGEAGCSWCVREEKQSLAHLMKCQDIQGVVLRENDQRLGFCLGRDCHGIVPNTACVDKESQKTKVCFSFPLPPFWLHSLAKVICFWLKSVAAKGGKHQNPQLLQSTAPQIVFIIHSLCWLLAFTPGSLVTSFLKVSAFADSQHQMCRIRHWNFPRLLNSCSVTGMLLLLPVSAIHCPQESKMGAVFSHTSFLCRLAEGTDFSLLGKWDQRLNLVSKV